MSWHHSWRVDGEARGVSIDGERLRRVGALSSRNGASAQGRWSVPAARCGKQGRKASKSSRRQVWFSQASARLPAFQRIRSGESVQCVVSVRPGALAAGEAFL